MDVTVILPDNYDNDWIRKIIDAFDALGWDVKFAQVKTLYTYPTQPFWYSSGTTTGKEFTTTFNDNTRDVDGYE